MGHQQRLRADEPLKNSEKSSKMSFKELCFCYKTDKGTLSILKILVNIFSVA
jgi:hypothetical protein